MLSQLERLDEVNGQNEIKDKCGFGSEITDQLEANYLKSIKGKIALLKQL